MLRKRRLGLASLVFILVPTITLTDEATTLKEIMQGLVDSSDRLLLDDFDQVAAILKETS